LRFSTSKPEKKVVTLQALHFLGMGLRYCMPYLQKVFHVIAEAPGICNSQQANKFWPSATINGEITPEYMGVGYM
jgi:hypothetical protein